MPMRCPKCGKVMMSAKHCPKCGTKLVQISIKELPRREFWRIILLMVAVPLLMVAVPLGLLIFYTVVFGIPLPTLELLILGIAFGAVLSLLLFAAFKSRKK